jgi:hypothetical protein
VSLLKEHWWTLNFIFDLYYTQISTYAVEAHSTENESDLCCSGQLSGRCKAQSPDSERELFYDLCISGF